MLRRGTVVRSAALAVSGLLVWGCLGLPNARTYQPVSADHQGAATLSHTGQIVVNVSMPSSKRVQSLRKVQDQQTDDTNVEALIDYVVITVSPVGNPAPWGPPLTATITKQQLGTGRGFTAFRSVPVGQVNISAVAYGADHKELANTNAPTPQNALPPSNTTLGATGSPAMPTLSNTMVTVVAANDPSYKGPVEADLQLTWEAGGLNAVLKVWVGSPYNLAPGAMGPLQAGALVVGGASAYKDAFDSNGQQMSMDDNILSGQAYSCGTCHAPEQAVFAGTPVLTTDNMGIKTYTATGSHAMHDTFMPGLGKSCYTCHTTGTDPDTGSTRFVNGSRYGVDFSTTSGNSPNTGYLGIQCEACHGGGSDHISEQTLDGKLSSITRYPSWKTTCIRCHQSTYNKSQRMDDGANGLNGAAAGWANANSTGYYSNYNGTGHAAPGNGGAGSHDGSILPSFPTYLVSQEEVNAGGGGQINNDVFPEHGKQGILYLGGGGYLFNTGMVDANNNPIASPRLNAQDSGDAVAWAKANINPFATSSVVIGGQTVAAKTSSIADAGNPHRDSMGNGCINCHMNPADPFAHNPNLDTDPTDPTVNPNKLAGVVQLTCTNCHQQFSTADDVGKYIDETNNNDLTTIGNLLKRFRTNHAVQIMEADGTKVTSNSPNWTGDANNLALPVTQWDDTPATASDANNNVITFASGADATNHLSDNAPTFPWWSHNMTIYDGAWWNYALLNGMTTAADSFDGEKAGGIHNPPYIRVLLRQTTDALNGLY